MFSRQGLAALTDDICIPLQYGVDPCVGDTICAGGILYGQRSIPVVLDFRKDIPEVAATGAARTVPAGDPAALHEALRELLSDPTALAAMAERAGAAAEGTYAWDRVARQTLDLYESLRENPGR